MYSTLLGRTESPEYEDGKETSANMLATVLVLRLDAELAVDAETEIILKRKNLHYLV